MKAKRHFHLLFFIVFFHFACLAQQNNLIINEIMYTPLSGAAEWIELYNPTPQAINLQFWILHDATSARPAISELPTWIQAYDYLVIAKDNSILTGFPDLTLRLVVMTKLPSLNNSGDDVTLAMPDSTVMDFVPYKPEWGGANGSSIERIDPSAPSTDPANWGSSVDAAHATPGLKNSIASLDYDLTIGSVSVDGNAIFAFVKNAGLQESGDAMLALFQDVNCDRIAQSSEEIGRLPVARIGKHDSVSVRFVGALRIAGANEMILCIISSEDQRQSDDTLAFTVLRPPSFGALTINEIMYAPLTDQAEWVEYINTTHEAVNVNGFFFSRKPSSDGKRTLIPVAKTSTLVQPDGYLVIASDSTILSSFPLLSDTAKSVCVLLLNRSSLGLANEGDEAVLLDPAGTTIDSVCYAASWHNPNVTSTTGRSIERLNPMFPAQRASSWSTCTRACGGTPGMRNSVFTCASEGQTEGAPALRCSPNPFSPDGDGFEDFCVVSYHLSSVVAQIRLRVFDRQGRMVRTIASNEPAGRSGDIVWDGLDDSKQRLRIGMYILLLEAVDAKSQETETLKCVAVVASKL